MDSLEGRLSKLEERQALRAGEEIMRRARAASTDDLARFLLALELAEPEATFQEAEAQAWACLDVSMEMAQTAHRQDGWAEQLGDQLGALLARRPRLWQHMRDRYPEATLRHFGEDYWKEREG